MKFEKYNIIENSYRQKIIDKIMIDKDLMGMTWYVNEKIHGANLQIFIEGTGSEFKIRFAKRSGFIEANEKFYGLENNSDKFVNYGFRVAEFIAKHSNVGMEFQAVICGELYGGGYDHPDVENTNDPRVQKQVQYTNHNEFMAFDLIVNGEIQDVDVMARIFAECDIPNVPFVFKGSFSKCLEQQNDFESLVPEVHGHPPIPNNICEGVVIRPAKTSYFNNGKRIILKNKNVKFSEKSRKRESKVIIFSDEQNTAIENMSQYINENRLNNMLSHFGEVKQKDFGKIAGLFAQDVILEYLRDGYIPIEEKKDWKLVTKQTQTCCSILLRQDWLNILDNTV